MFCVCRTLFGQGVDGHCGRVRVGRLSRTRAIREKCSEGSFHAELISILALPCGEQKRQSSAFEIKTALTNRVGGDILSR